MPDKVKKLFETVYGKRCHYEFTRRDRALDYPWVASSQDVLSPLPRSFATELIYRVRDEHRPAGIPAEILEKYE